MKDLLISGIQTALRDIGVNDTREIHIEKPADEKFGDASTNIAMVLAKELKKNPRQIAADIVAKLPFRNDAVERTEIAGAGFINFYFSNAFVTNAVQAILEQGESFGRSSVGAGKKALVEYVSANPTGPLTVGRGRGGVLGDTIANLLDAQGYSVTREYYFNNAGRQMRILGDSVKLRYLELCGEKMDFPDDYYQGNYIKDIAQKIFEQFGDSKKEAAAPYFFKEFAEAEIFESIKQTLHRLGIRHDSFFNELELYRRDCDEPSRNDRVIAELDNLGYIERKDGAIWLKTSLLGKKTVNKETKEEVAVDTVLVKSNGEPSYRLPDIAYHITKYERGFDLMVNVFGADHIDEYPDVLRALKALGYDETRVKVAINQFVTTTVNGEVVKMSTRKGNADLLDALIDDVGADATRFFFMMRSKESHLNFDLELAKKQSSDNPVFYLQYAHARICGIVRVAEDTSGFTAKASEYGLLSVLAAKEELELAKTLLRFPEAIEVAAESLEPQKLINYLNDVAAAFHKFYVECRIVGEEERVMKSRLYLSLATRQVLKNGFKILGISAPEKM
ncbi:MAG: arginyl-tRNA synthetase [[Candidatus Thermochlorobacteriaceae] bacterium GBChlB]|nr:MAG: arginyl-tRNA synthetase [[Candidatus Thermochlorobacteriaceae] bacterium GBChlB]